MATHITSPSELTEKAQEILDTVIAQCEDGNKACVVGLSGELGAGKTTFVKEVARSFGITEAVTSPTFLIEKIYQLPEKAPYTRLVHIDAYRLESGDDLRGLGFEELISDPNNLILIEWPEHVSDVLPSHTRTLAFTVTGEERREITVADNE